MGIVDYLKRHKWIMGIAAVLIAMIVALRVFTPDSTLVLSGILLNHDLTVTEESAAELGNAFLSKYQTEAEVPEVVLLREWTYYTDDEERAEDNYYTIQALAVYAQEGLLDFVTCDQAHMVLLAYGVFFEDLSKILTPEQLERYKPYLRYMDQAVLEEAKNMDGEDLLSIANGVSANFPDCSKPEEMDKPVPIFIDLSQCEGLTALYPKDCGLVGFAVMQNAPNPDAVRAWIDYLMG